MPYPDIGQPLWRASDAHGSVEKWHGWILAAHGHGPEWERVFGLEPNDSDQLWEAIARAVLDAPVSTAGIALRTASCAVWSWSWSSRSTTAPGGSRPRGTTSMSRLHPGS